MRHALIASGALCALLATTACTQNTAKSTRVKKAEVRSNETVELNRQAGAYPGELPAVTITDTMMAQPASVAPRDEAMLPNYFEPETESYEPIDENPFRSPLVEPLSTFSIDVDTASYSNTRRFLNGGQLPPAGAVRIEEFVNYFDYDYPEPDGDEPFSVSVETAECPWQPQHRLVRVGLKAAELRPAERPPANLVFLVDVSGSMNDANKLPLVQQSLKELTAQLDARDRISIVVYAGASGLVLDGASATGGQVAKALGRLQAGGSTNGAAGIELAYDTAARHFIRDGVNRVILCTDGDFNVGTSSRAGLEDLITEKAKGGTFLTVLGFGMGNYRDSTTELLADRGNGAYAYIDTINEARKVLVEEMQGTLVTVAKDVKIQVEFNPLQVGAYRLVGYENRALAAEDFNDDAKDAGEIGAGHTVTAFYEIVPAGLESETATLRDVDALRYQQPRDIDPATTAHEMLTVKLRYKAPDGDESLLLSRPVVDDGRTLADASDDFLFGASVASFAMLLRDGEHAGLATYGLVRELAQSGLDDDPFGYRAEFASLVEKAAALSANQGAGEM